MQILPVESEICHIFNYHVNILSKLMTQFITESVEVVHFISIITNFSVQALQS